TCASTRRWSATRRAAAVAGRRYWTTSAAKGCRASAAGTATTASGGRSTAARGRGGKRPQDWRGTPGGQAPSKREGRDRTLLDPPGGLAGSPWVGNRPGRPGKTTSHAN